jgi:hypothetical protein
MSEIITKLYKDEVTVRFVEGNHAYYVTDPAKGLVNKRLKGSTTIEGIKDKSRPLCIWATELARDFLEEKLVKNGIITVVDVYEAANLYNVRRDEAANLGTEIHDWCEKFIKHSLKSPGYENMPLMPANRNVKIGAGAFLDWAYEHNVKFISSERLVYSRNYLNTGTLDIEAEIDGKLSLTDLKTSNGLYNDVRLQTASYASFDMEENEYSGTPKVYQTRWAIRLSKETEKEYIARMEKKGRADFPEYKIFEAKEFPEVAGDDIASDFKAFLAAKDLYEWNDRTDFWKENKAKAIQLLKTQASAL